MQKKNRFNVRYLIPWIFLCTSCITDSSDSSEPVEQNNYLYVVNRSTKSLQITDVSISGIDIHAFWLLQPGKFTYLTVDPEQPNVLKPYPDGTTITFVYSWEYLGGYPRQTTGTTLNGTKTIKFRDASLDGWVTMNIENGDTRNSFQKIPLGNDKK